MTAKNENGNGKRNGNAIAPADAYTRKQAEESLNQRGVEFERLVRRMGLDPDAAAFPKEAIDAFSQGLTRRPEVPKRQELPRKPGDNSALIETARENHQTGEDAANAALKVVRGSAEEHANIVSQEAKVRAVNTAKLAKTTYDATFSQAMRQLWGTGNRQHIEQVRESLQGLKHRTELAKRQIADPNTTLDLARSESAANSQELKYFDDFVEDLGIDLDIAEEGGDPWAGKE
ncbi:MAG: hypothetical protein J7642_21230 [Cyanobacteria bacterium SBC]|nr:hypothetical protein [Cyanobacteria bacterium SBC]